MHLTPPSEASREVHLCHIAYSSLGGAKNWYCRAEKQGRGYVGEDSYASLICSRLHNGYQVRRPLILRRDYKDLTENDYPA
jgi:hypothetical protein